MATKQLLIDASEAKKKMVAVKEWFNGYPYPSTEQDKLAQAVAQLCIDEVKKLKPVDAVEVVRCKDCQYRKKDDVGRNYCGLGDFYCGDTDYCSRGQKKMVNLEDIVDLDAQTKANNEAMRKVISFMAGEMNFNSSIAPVWQLPVTSGEDGPVGVRSNVKFHCFVDGHALCNGRYQNTEDFDDGITIESAAVLEQPHLVCKRCLTKWKRKYRVED